MPAANSIPDPSGVGVWIPAETADVREKPLPPDGVPLDPFESRMHDPGSTPCTCFHPEAAVLENPSLLRNDASSIISRGGATG